MQFEVERTRKEKDVIKKHADYLEGELKKIMEELAETKKSTSHELILLKSHLSTSQSSLAASVERVTLLTNSLSTSERLADKHQKAYSDERKKSAEAEQSYEDQQAKLQALVDTQKRRIGELEGSIEAMDESLEKIRKEERESAEEKER